MNKIIGKTKGFMILAVLVISFFAPFLSTAWASESPIHEGHPFFTQKWVRTGLPNGFGGVITANLDADPYEEVIVAGTGAIMCLDGQSGAVQWVYINNAIGFYCQPQMADLNGDGAFEIIVPIEFPPAVVVLHGNGTIWWERPLTGEGREGSVTSSPVVADIDGNRHPTIFVGREDIIYPYNGGIAALSWNGQIIAETWAYRPCSGGFSLADVNNDGVFTLFMGDRESPGNGVRALNAHTLQPLWNRSDILSSSYCPVLADVTGDSILDVVVTNMRNRIYVLDAVTGVTIRQTASMGMPGHYQHVVHDIDEDGNLELILADGTHYGTPNYILIWDLVDWKEDARIDVGRCVYPPQVGYVTGNSLMDIIACNYTGVFIYSHDQESGTYILLDQITGLVGELTYAVVQDIDNDGLNEVIVQSIGRRVYVFDTVAHRPNPRARSEVQFYSECRLGAAEYVPPTFVETILPTPSPFPLPTSTPESQPTPSPASSPSPTQSPSPSPSPSSSSTPTLEPEPYTNRLFVLIIYFAAGVAFFLGAVLVVRLMEKKK